MNEFDTAPEANDSSDDELVSRLREMIENEAALDVFGDTEDEFVSKLRELKEVLDIKDGAAVIYPGSSSHLGVARVFGREHVVHVDPDKRAALALDEAGCTVVQAGIEDYHPEKPADVMVALNSYGSPSEAMVGSLIKPGGWIITNNYTEWAHEISELPGVKLEAVVLPYYSSPDAKIVTGSEIPEDATDISTEYLKISRSGKIEAGTKEDHNIANQAARHPDALFAFRVLE
jgi:hypothetical protein